MSEIKERIDEVIQENRKLKKTLSELNHALSHISVGIDRQEMDDALEYSDKYNKGRDDAWSTVRNIMTMQDSYKAEIFQDCSTFHIIMNNSASESIKKIKDYEDKQKQIQVGDEVIAGDTKAIVTKIDEKFLYVTFKDGSSGQYNIHWHNEVIKTGKTYPQFIEILEKMNENE